MADRCRNRQSLKVYQWEGSSCEYLHVTDRKNKKLFTDKNSRYGVNAQEAEVERVEFPLLQGSTRHNIG